MVVCARVRMVLWYEHAFGQFSFLIESRNAENVLLHALEVGHARCVFVSGCGAVHYLIPAIY